MSVVFTTSQIIALKSVVENVHPVQDLLTTVGKINVRCFFSLLTAQTEFKTAAQYGIADAVLIWRVWVLCKSEYRLFLRICSVFLGLTYREPIDSCLLLLEVNLA